MRFAVLVSGNGSNLQALMDACAAGRIQGELVGVLSNRPDAFALERAKAAGIATQVLSNQAFSDRDSYDAALIQALETWQPDLLVMAGFMRILTPAFVQHFAGRMLNIHPSLLPKYQGVKTHARAIAAGDTARWIIGDTESGSGATRRVHILVKPTRPDISTNLVVTTDRRTYMIELRARESLYMPAVAWAYPATPGQRQTVPAAPVIPAEAARNYRYGLQVQGDSPPWRPVSVFDDGRRVYVVFPAGIVQGEMPPIFVLGTNGEPQIVNSRVHQNVLIVDRLFGAAELRLGSGNRQQVVRIVRINPTQAAAARPASVTGDSPS